MSSTSCLVGGGCRGAELFSSTPALIDAWRVHQVCRTLLLRRRTRLFFRCKVDVVGERFHFAVFCASIKCLSEEHDVRPAVRPADRVRDRLSELVLHLIERAITDANSVPHCAKIVAVRLKGEDTGLGVVVDVSSFTALMSCSIQFNFCETLSLVFRRQWLVRLHGNPGLKPQVHGNPGLEVVVDVGSV